MSTIPGYAAPIRQDRTVSGGGVAVGVKSNLYARHLDTIDCKGFEVVWLLVDSCSHGKVVVCAVYRSGSSSPSDCSVIDYLDSSLPAAQQLGDHVVHVVFAGDFNVHNSTWLKSSKTTLAGLALEDLASAYCLTQHISRIPLEIMPF